MTSCDSICIGEWIFLFLWCISVPTYSMVIYVIWKHRKTEFKGEFWLLTMSLFAADILHLCQSTWGMKMSVWGALPSVLKQAPKLVGWLIIVPKWALFFAEVMGVVFISLNRYLAIVKTSVYEVRWSRKVTVLCICVQWGSALFLLFCASTFEFDLEPTYYNNRSGFTSVVDQKNSKKVGAFLGVLVGVGGMFRVLLFITVYGHMFHHVYKHNKVMAAVGLNHQPTPSFSRTELKLAIIGALLAFCDMAITLNIVDVAIHINQNSDKVDLERMRFWLFRGVCFSDIYGWMNGWMLLAFSSVVREQFFLQYGCVKKPVSQTKSTQRLHNQ